MTVPSRAVRVALLPATLACLAIISSVLLIVLVAGLIAYPFGSRRRALRIAWFGLVYCGMEVVVLARGLGIWLRHRRSPPAWEAANDRLLEWALATVLGSARVRLGFTVVVEGSGSAAALTGDEPVLVLARHGGPGDSFSLVYLLEGLFHRRTRLVAKDILQLDPAIDLLLNRRGSCFVGSPGGGSRNPERLAACTAGLQAGDALLLFPEGENWTPRRRLRAIRRLRERRRQRSARAAELMDNVLPPRPSGVAACLGARTDLRVVVAAHTGLDRIVSVAGLWRALPFQTPMTVRFWPVETPAGEVTTDRVTEWLTCEWSMVDQWIDKQREAAQVVPGSAAP